MARAVMLIPLVLALCVACATTPAPFVPGPQVLPPAGWLGYCDRHPDDHDCNKD
jgi:hypothetical protein